MDRPQVADRDRGNACFHRLASVGLALIPQHVRLGRDHQGLRQPGQGLGRGPQRCGGRFGAHRAVGGVVVPKPLHPRAGEEEAVRELLVGRRVEAGVQRRVEQHLLQQVGPAPALGQQGGGDGQVAARALSPATASRESRLRPGPPCVLGAGASVSTTGCSTCTVATGGGALSSRWTGQRPATAMSLLRWSSSRFPSRKISRTTVGSLPCSIRSRTCTSCSSRRGGRRTSSTLSRCRRPGRRAAARTGRAPCRRRWGCVRRRPDGGARQ
jgi:hypothetical protein